MVENKKYSDKTTFKKAGPENIQTFWNHKKHWLKSISVKVTRRIDDNIVDV